MATATGTYATAALAKARIGGTFDAADDAVIASLCDQINQYIEDTTGRVLAPVASATYLFDGDGLGVLHFPAGIRAVTLLEIADSTGAAFSTVASTDYYLRPLAQDRRPGWPAMEIRFSNAPVGTYTTFRSGYANVRVTMTTGWAAIPDSIIELALSSVVRAWHARQIGQPESLDGGGAPVVTNYLSRRDRATLALYSRSRLPF